MKDKIQVEFKPSYACTQNCEFCCFKNLKAYGMNYPEIKQRLEIIKKNHKNPEIFILSGGEPTIYNNFFEIIKYIDNEIKPKKLIIHSNGLFFNNMDNIKKIKKYNPIIFVSLHTLSNKFYRKYISKNYSIEKIKQGIINMKKGKIKVIIDTLIFKENIRELPDILKFVIKNKIKEIEIRFPYALDYCHELNTIKNYKEYLNIINKIIKKYKNKIKIHIHPSQICAISSNYNNPEQIKALKTLVKKNHNNKQKNYFFYGPNIRNNGDPKHANQQLKAVNKKWKKDFLRIANCKVCRYKISCLGVPKEYIIS